MLMPFKKTAQTDNDQDETAEPQSCYAFRFRAYWFVLAQTKGEDTYTPPIPDFGLIIANPLVSSSPPPSGSGYPSRC